MSDTNQEQEDAVLRRMLATPPAPRKPKDGSKDNSPSKAANKR